MPLLRIICWATIFLARIRFPPGVVTSHLQVESRVESSDSKVESRVESFQFLIESSQWLHSSRVSGFTRVKLIHWSKSSRVNSYT